MNGRQLDIFAAPIEGAPTSFQRTWTDGRNKAFLMVSQWDDQLWCYGIQLMTATAGRSYAPMPKWNGYASFADAVEAGMDEILATLRAEAASHHSSAPAFRRLLAAVEAGQPEEREWHNPEDLTARQQLMADKPCLVA